MRRNVKKCCSLSKKMVLGASLALVATGSAWAADGNSTSPHADMIENVMQDKAIKGVVVDVAGEPIIGANVVVKGTTNGVITDFDGNFTLNVPLNCTLQISYIGYKTQEVKVTGATSHLSIKLEEDSETLDEVVVVGYGVQKKANLTGAVSAVDFEEQAKSRPVTTVSAALAGLSAGVQVMQNSGQPGSDGATIRVRGVGTLNDANPLVLIDGMEGSMDNVNAQDIESISILKDAASCAIYGSRAANGVILINTKRGKGRVSVNYSGRLSYAQPTNLIDFVNNYADYMELINESFTNIGQPAHFNQSTIDLWREKSLRPNEVNALGVPNYVAYPNTNWQDEIFKNGIINDHNVSLSGGTENVRFLTSLGYLDNPGLVDNTGIKKYKVRVNLEADVAKWLTVGTRVYGDMQDQDAGNFSNANNYLRQTTPGIYPEWNGSYGYPEAPEESPTANGILQFLNNQNGTRKKTNVNATAFSKVTFMKGLTWTFNFNYKRYWYEARTWTHASDQVKFSTGEVIKPGTTPDLMSTSFSNEGNWSYTLENILNYNTTIAKNHNIGVMAGYQEWYKYWNTSNASLKGLIDETINVPSSATEMVSIGGTANDRATRSFFGRLNYDYKGIYLFEANLRYDGNSRYGKDYRWGTFPSFSAGWRISEEAFMAGTRSWLDNLKIRASWGKLGNDGGDDVGNYEYQSVYGITDYSFGGKQVSGLAMTGLANAALGWETSNNTNFGIDFAALGNRLTATFDVYNKRTTGILTTRSIPITLGGLSAPRVNIAKMDAKGFEIDLGWRDRIGKVEYSVKGNFSYTANKVKNYNGRYYEGWKYEKGKDATGAPIYGYTRDKNGNYNYVDKNGNVVTDDSQKVWGNNAGDVFNSGNSSSPIVEGHMKGEWFLMDAYKGSGKYFDAQGNVMPGGGPKDGMIRTEEDMEWLKAMIAAGYEFWPNKTIGKNNIWYGDVIYADANGDGIYGNSYDKVFHNVSSDPKYTFGFQASAAWNGFDFSMNWAGTAGRKLYWGYTTGYNSSGTRVGVGLPKMIAEDHYYYDPENPSDPRTNINGKYCRLTNGESGHQDQATSTRFLYSGDYLKLKNITIGYTLPKNVTNKLFTQSIRVYLSGENLLSIDNFPGQDPEIGSTPEYTSVRSFAFGANITF
ncbi:TonB-dependent receptor [Phocaeicola sp.]|uniref:SusC/RagA family TonB-linked outer membrane protein n=1 Tax=Phocaeicola sp. TaxID=2773926 RepID=UPI0023BD1FBB|nr:TonB-dependent receptor [Phocaeicola sp.]MDE5678674.1 TonB-dependent receptor [Phocaeicola sp.]